MEENHVNCLADIFGCRVGIFHTKYLVLPLCLGLPTKSLWDPMVERLDKSLISWKGRYLSMGGGLTLLKSVLSSISIYFLFCFWCPKGVMRRIEKFQHDSFGMIRSKRGNLIW